MAPQPEARRQLTLRQNARFAPPNWSHFLLNSAEFRADTWMEHSDGVQAGCKLLLLLCVLVLRAEEPPEDGVDW